MGETELKSMSIEQGRARLLEALGQAEDVTFIRGHGNIGDDLIYAGARQLLSGVDYREVSVLRLEGIAGDTALIGGSGAWCNTYGAMPGYLSQVEARFQRVIVLPSSFDVSAPSVRDALSRTKAKVFARELVSYERIRGLCDADLAHDCALYYDFRPYRRRGRGTLTAYRTDPEAARRRLPVGNNDISMTCESLDEWLWIIARHERVLTDRAHVTIAAAMLGKRVEYGTSNYHKVPAIVGFSLRGLQVRRVEEADEEAAEPCEPQGAQEPARLSASRRDSREQTYRAHVSWLDTQRRAREEIEAIVLRGQSFVFVDDNQWGREPVADGRRPIPFLEKEGLFWGQPENDAQAIAELERLCAGGAAFVIFAWTAFWWINHYAGLWAHLEQRGRLIFRNERLVVFDLRP